MDQLWACILQQYISIWFRGKGGCHGIEDCRNIFLSDSGKRGRGVVLSWDCILQQYISIWFTGKGCVMGLYIATIYFYLIHGKRGVLWDCILQQYISIWFGGKQEGWFLSISGFFLCALTKITSRTEKTETKLKISESCQVTFNSSFDHPIYIYEKVTWHEPNANSDWT